MLEMQFNADKGLGWSIYRSIKIRKHGISAFLHTVCIFSNLQLCVFRAMRFMRINRIRMANSRSHISLSQKCKERKICCPKKRHVRTTLSVLHWGVHLGLVRKRKSPHVNWPHQYKAAIPTPSSLSTKESSLRLGTCLLLVGIYSCRNSIISINCRFN